jgi:hypothetical protein
MDVAADTKSIKGLDMHWRGYTCIYTFEEPILRVLGLSFPAVPGVQVFG